MDRRFAFRTFDLRNAGLRAGGAGSWRAWLALALGGAAVAALLLVLGLVFLLLIPVFAVAGLVGRWWLGRKLREHAATMQRRSGVIEGEYEVLGAGTTSRPASSDSPWHH